MDDRSHVILSCEIVFLEKNQESIGIFVEGNIMNFVFFVENVSVLNLK